MRTVWVAEHHAGPNWHGEAGFEDPEVAESYAAEQQAESGIPHRVVRYVPAPTKKTKSKAKKGTR